MEIKTTRTPKVECPWCGKLLDAVTGGREPRKDDVTICLGCLNLTVFNEQLLLEKPNKETFAQIRNDEKIWSQIQRVRLAIRDIQKKK